MLDELAGSEVGSVRFDFGANTELHWCPKCESYKQMDEFSPCGGQTSRIVDSYCKVCRAAISRTRAITHPRDRAKVRASQMKCVYGVTPEEVNARFEEQGRRCAACGAETSGSKLGWCTEHNHATKKFRGVVCHPCNSTIGFSKESVERLLACVAYLQRNEEAPSCQQ